MKMLSISDEVGHHGPEVSEWLHKTRVMERHDQTEIKNLVGKFTEEHGSNSRVISGLGGALLEGYRRTKDSDRQVAYASALVYLASSLSEGNEKRLKNLSGEFKVEKSPGIKDLSELFIDILSGDIRCGESMLKVRNGGLPIREENGEFVDEGISKLMNFLIRAYDKTEYKPEIADMVHSVVKGQSERRAEIEDRFNRTRTHEELSRIKPQ